MQCNIPVGNCRLAEQQRGSILYNILMSVGTTVCGGVHISSTVPEWEEGRTIALAGVFSSGVVRGVVLVFWW